ncbi:hypothetical protein GCM10027596_31480 [Nocardioides korecus]
MHRNAGLTDGSPAMNSASCEGEVGSPRSGGDRDGPGDPLAVQLVASGRGDEVAFAALYDDVGPRVYGLVLRILRDAHQSEEVTQEVFLQV